MTTLVPACTATLGGQRWTDGVLAVEVDLGVAPLVGTATVRLAAGSPIVAAPGDPAEIELDGGEGAATVLTGTVTSVRRGLHDCAVGVVDAGGLLARSRPATTFEKASAGTVIRALATAAGVTAGTVDDGPALTWYAADPARTALDHVTRLAAWSGAVARVDAAGRLVVTSLGATQAELALRHGREVLALAQTERLRDVESFTVAGEGGAGSAQAPEALRPTSDFFAGNRPDGPDGGHLWVFEPALRTTSAAGAAGAAAGWRYKAGGRVGTLDAFLLPGLRPATVLEIQDLPDGLDGAPVWAARVRHRFAAGGGARTAATLRAGGPAAAGGPGGLLGAAAGAAAGALGP